MKNPLATKSSFYKFSFAVFGVPCAIFAIAFLGREGDYAQWFVLGALGLLGGPAWAALTWPYLRGANRRLEAAARKDRSESSD